MCQEMGVVNGMVVVVGMGDLSVKKSIVGEWGCM